MRLSRVAIALTYLIALGLGALLGIFISADQLLVSDDGVLGVSVHTDQADPGYVLVPRLGSLDDEPTTGDVHLINKDGSVIHDWTLEYPVGGHAELMANGDLVFLGVGDDELQLPGYSGVLRRVTWDGDEVWTIRDPLIHHDFDVLPDGTVAVLRWSPVDDEAARRVLGGRPGSELEGVMYSDEIIEIAADGSRSVVWEATWILDPNTDVIPDRAMRAEWTHANSVEYLPNNPFDSGEAYLVSLRQLSLVLIVSRETGELLWRYGGDGALNQQHDAQMLSSGNVLLFDNGQYRRDGFPSSEVQEVNPLTNTVDWRYQGRGLFGWRLFSPVVSGAERLPNGNTLITEGLPGRLIEVTAEGEVVWEYRNPFFKSQFGGGPNQAIFKARSYPASFVDQ